MRTGCRQSGYQRSFVYDGEDLFLELNETGATLRKYTFYPGTDRPHSLRTGGQTYYYATDFPGNVVGLISSSNTVAARYRYAPMGELEHVSGTVCAPGATRDSARAAAAESSEREDLGCGCLGDPLPPEILRGFAGEDESHFA